MSDIEDRIIAAVKKRAIANRYTEEMTKTAIDMALAAHRSGMFRPKKKKRKK